MSRAGGSASHRAAQDHGPAGRAQPRHPLGDEPISSQIEWNKSSGATAAIAATLPPSALPGAR